MRSKSKDYKEFGKSIAIFEKSSNDEFAKELVKSRLKKEEAKKEENKSKEDNHGSIGRKSPHSQRQSTHELDRLSPTKELNSKKEENLGRKSPHSQRQSPHENGRNSPIKELNSKKDENSKDNLKSSSKKENDSSKKKRK